MFKCKQLLFEKKYFKDTVEAANCDHFGPDQK